MGYTFPKKLLSKTPISHLRFYVSGDNLLTLDSFLAFNDGALKRTGKAYRSAIQNIQVAANSAGKTTNIGKRAITAMSSSEIAILKSQLGNSFLRAETGLQVDSLRNQMQELAQVRDVKAQGGIKNYTAYMKTSGLASKALSGGNKIHHVPLGLESYTPFIQSNESVGWIDWQTKGYEYADMSDNCPFCTSHTADKKEKIRKVGQEYDKTNFLLMHAMGPNVAGVIGSAVAAGILLSFLA